MSQNNETAAMLVSQTSLVGVELLSYANAFFCSYEFAWTLATRVKIHSISVKQMVKNCEDNIILPPPEFREWVQTSPKTKD